MGVNHGNGHLPRGAARAKEDLIRAVIAKGIRHNARAYEFPARILQHPAPDDVAPQSHHVPGMDFLGPARHLLGVLLHELLDPRLVRLDHRARFRAELAVFLAADLLLSEQAHDEVGTVVAGAEDLRHRAIGAAVVLQQLLQPVFGLGVADCESRRFERRRVHVRDAELIAVKCGLVRRLATKHDGRKQDGARYGKQISRFHKQASFVITSRQQPYH